MHTLTLDDLRRSLQMRTLILDTEMQLLHSDPKPKGSFKRKFANEEAEKVAAEQSFRQTSTHKTREKRREVGRHNEEMLQEFREEEEGLDDDPENKFDEELFEKQVRD